MTDMNTYVYQEDVFGFAAVVQDDNRNVSWDGIQNRYLDRKGKQKIVEDASGRLHCIFFIETAY